MFKTLAIQNFQSHKESDLAFSEGVNVITGQSDSGKTACLRALSWLINNRPSGDAFKNWNVPLKEPVSVQLELENGQSISIKRENGKNTYATYDVDGHGDYFTAIKTDVPIEVSELLNLAEYNFQSQHQSYFLLQDTPGEIAKKLNDLVGLSIIDTLFSNLAGKIRQSSTQISIMTVRRDNTENDLKKYEKLDEIETIIDTLEKLYGENEATASSLSQIEQKLSTLTEIKTKRENLVPLIKAEVPVTNLSNLIYEVKETETKIETLSNLVSTIKKIQEDLRTERSWSELEPICEDLSYKVKEHAVESLHKTSIENIIGSLNTLDRNIAAGKTAVEELTSQYIDLIRESNTCPTCGNRINAACLVAIERSFK
jgi:exonuclease SbcC